MAFSKMFWITDKSDFKVKVRTKIQNATSGGFNVNVKTKIKNAASGNFNVTVSTSISNYTP